MTIYERYSGVTVPDNWAHASKLYKVIARSAHPDKGGNNADFKQLGEEYGAWKEYFCASAHDASTTLQDEFGRLARERSNAATMQERIGCLQKFLTSSDAAFIDAMKHTLDASFFMSSRPLGDMQRVFIHQLFVYDCVKALLAQPDCMEDDDFLVSESRVSDLIINILTPRNFREDATKEEIWDAYSFPMFRRCPAAEFIQQIEFRRCKTGFTNSGSIFLNQSSKLGAQEQASLIRFLEKRMTTEYYETIRSTLTELSDDKDYVARIMAEVHAIASTQTAASIQLGEAVAAADANLTRLLDAQRTENARAIEKIKSDADVARRAARDRYRTDLDALKSRYDNELDECMCKLNDYNEQLDDMDEMIAEARTLREEAERALGVEKIAVKRLKLDLEAASARARLDVAEEKAKLKEERAKRIDAENDRSHLERVRDRLELQSSSLRESLTFERREMQKQHNESTATLREAEAMRAEAEKDAKLRKSSSDELATKEKFLQQFTVAKNDYAKKYNDAVQKVHAREREMTVRLHARIAKAKQRTTELEQKTQKEKKEQENIIQELRIQLQRHLA